MTGFLLPIISQLVQLMAFLSFKSILLTSVTYLISHTTLLMRFNVSSKMIAMIISKKFGEKVVKNSENVSDNTLCVFILSLFYFQSH